MTTNRLLSGPTVPVLQLPSTTGPVSSPVQASVTVIAAVAVQSPKKKEKKKKAAASCPSSPLEVMLSS